MTLSRRALAAPPKQARVRIRAKGITRESRLLLVPSVVVSGSCFTVHTQRNRERVMTTMIRTTREQLLRQRAQLLEEIHMSYEQLRERAATYSLSSDELDVWHTIEGIDYLLEGDR
jgi:hypothetical protein